LRIRYILPTVPFMTILAVTGIRNGTEWLASRRQSALRLAGRAVPFAVALLIAVNLFYLGNQFTGVRPMSYILGEESRDEFLSRQVGSYPAMAFINRNLPDDAVVYLLFLSGRGYYLDREYRHHVGLETAIVKAMVRSSADTCTLTAFLKSLGGTHLLVRDELLMKALEDNFPGETARNVREMLAQSLKKVYESSGYSVYVIR
jgi:hypothetical protein